MFVISNLLNALAHVINYVLGALEFLIVVRWILSLANADPYNNLVQLVGTITEPFLKPFRKLFPPWKMSGWDISPACALLCIYFFRLFLVTTLFDIAARLK